MKEPSPSLHSILLRMREAQARDPLPPWDVRATRLRTLEKMLNEQRVPFAEAIDADFGHRPQEETELLELRKWHIQRGSQILPLRTVQVAVQFQHTERIGDNVF